MRRSRPNRLESLPRRKAAFIEPMECATVPNLPDGSEWTFCGGPHKSSYIQIRPLLGAVRQDHTPLGRHPTSKFYLPLTSALLPWSLAFPSITWAQLPVVSSYGHYWSKPLSFWNR